MLEINTGNSIFKTKNIFFSDSPYNVNNCSQVKFLFCNNDVFLEGFTKSSHQFMIINLTQDLDVIWKNMRKSSCRYAITKARRDGITVKINDNYEEFFEINSSFRKKKHYYEFPNGLEFIKKEYTLFVSVYNGEILSGQMYLEDSDNIFLFIGASKRFEVNSEKATLIGNANKLLIWEAMEYAKNKRIKKFNLGEYWENDSQCSFKKCFGGELVTLYQYEKKYSKLYKLTAKVYRQMPKIIKKRRILNKKFYLR